MISAIESALAAGARRLLGGDLVPVPALDQPGRAGRSSTWPHELAAAAMASTPTAAGGLRTAARRCPAGVRARSAGPVALPAPAPAFAVCIDLSPVSSHLWMTSDRSIPVELVNTLTGRIQPTIGSHSGLNSVEVLTV